MYSLYGALQGLRGTFVGIAIGAAQDSSSGALVVLTEERQRSSLEAAVWRPGCCCSAIRPPAWRPSRTMPWRHPGRRCERRHATRRDATQFSHGCAACCVRAVVRSGFDFLLPGRFSRLGVKKQDNEKRLHCPPSFVTPGRSGRDHAPRGDAPLHSLRRD